jgi:hypothetical protein
MVARRVAPKGQPRRRKKPPRKSKTDLPGRVLNQLRRQLLLGAPEDPEGIPTEVGRALRDELLRDAPALPEEY